MNQKPVGFRSASGVVLSRRIVGEGDLLLTLFLKGMGMTFASAPGAAGGKVRFGGGTEPMVWGVFGLYQGKGEEGRKYLKSVDIADDMLKLRTSARALFMAVGWAKLLTRHLMEGHPADDLLANLYWNMKLLNEGEISAEVLEWRFIWRWLKSWGLAPELAEWADCAPWELELLRRTSGAKTPELKKLTADVGKAGGALFARAARRAEIFLKEI
ncbi:MAG: recombination protein O N-terminal domain-containing protein [Synergistaceae bacterium]|nr:recombination protein O N-terminal domain-containing protein [Synergistaceae bacterium]